MSNSERGLRFWKWAAALGHWYFNGEMAQRPVRLHWPTDEEFSGREDEFLLVLREWSPFRGPVEVACELSRRWNPSTGEVTASWAIPELPPEGRCDRPPYLPYLVAFAMAWGTEGDFESNAYYPRLNQILGQQKTPINSGSFMNADCLWGDLEHWADNVMDGDLGRFTAVTLGGMEHIGYPMSQVVLKPTERHQLERIFAREGLTREMALTDLDIQELLSKNLDQFGSRIRHSIETAGSRFARALFEEVRIQLASTASLDAPGRTGGGGRQAGESIRQIRLQLACRMGLHSICGWFFTSESDGDDLPDAAGGRYAFRPGHVDGVLWQQPNGGMATPDVAAFAGFSPLSARLSLRAEDGTPVIWPGHDVRFLSPSRDLAGVYVERDFVPDRAPIIVLCGESDADLVREVAIAEVPGVTWQGVSAWRVDSPRDLVEAFPKRRNYARRASPIRCTGGIRCYPHGAEYFPFSLPRIVVDDGWQPKARTPGVTIEPTDDDSLFRLCIDVCKPPSPHYS